MAAALNENHWAERCLTNMRQTVSLLAERAPLLAEMAEYHLGWTGDLAGEDRYRGKMIRPMIAIYAAAGGIDFLIEAGLLARRRRRGANSTTAVISAT